MTGSLLHEQTYRRVSASHASAREAAWVHRGLAYVVALAVNLALIGVFLFNSPPQYLKPGIAARSEVLTVSIITAAQDAAEASEASVAESPPAEAGPRPALVEREATPAQTTDETQDKTEAPPGIPVLGPNAGPRDEPGAALAIVRPGPPEAGPGPTVRSTLRSLSCAQRLGREGPNPGCRNAVPGYAWGPHINPQALAQVEQQVDAQFSALASLFGHPHASDWPTGPYRAGDLTLAAPSRSLPASDSMRDRLPPSVPDPAFGD